MNITEYIVAHLKQGLDVELPGIGTFTVRHTDVHYDSASDTLFPAQQTLAFEPRCSGDNSIVQYIADQECISMATAQQMFKNYLEALREKLDTVHSHTFDGIGTITKEGFGCSFKADPQLSLSTDNKLRMPISNVKTYKTAAYEDPFAQFSQPFRKECNSADPQDMPAPKPPVVPPAHNTGSWSAPSEVMPVEADATTSDEAADDSMTEEVCAAAIKERIVVPDAGAQEAPAEQQTHIEHAMSVHAEDGEDKATIEEAQQERALTEESEEASPWEAQHEKADEQTEPQTQPDALASLQTMEKLAMQNENVKEYDGTGSKAHNPAGGVSTSTKKKHSGRVVIIVLLLLLLILGGMAAYYYFKIYRPGHSRAISDLNIEEMVTGSEGIEKSEPAGIAAGMTSGNTSETDGSPVSAVSDEGASAVYVVNNDFTQTSDAIRYDSEDISSISSDIYSYLRAYINNYLQSRHYSKAEEAMQQKVLSFTQGRLTEMMQADGYHAQSFFNYCSHDYQHTYLEKDLKEHHTARQRVVMQRELMNTATLGRLLDEVLQDSEIAADPHNAAAQPRPVQKTYAAATREVTKKGFDVIAGFYVNRTSADVMASNLKKKGCDAYVINRNGLYYVSMGSAGSQTEAEHLYHHIKEWYKGDVAIKKW